MEATSRITVSRLAGQYVDRGRAYRVLVDGSEVARLKAGEIKSLPVSPGRHEVQLRIDWCQSPVQTVELGAGQEAKLLARPGVKSPLGVLVASFFKHDRYLDLQVL